jgi:hopene-associated glycosyltransferase HpnB
MMLATMLVVCLAWLWLLFNRGMFWLVDPLKEYPAPADWPEVVAIIPARNEAAGIAETVRSLLTQDYPGKLSVIVTDDHSDDGTAGIAYAAALDLEATERVTIVAAPPLPSDWAGKMWAQQQGVTEAASRYPAAALFLLTDADIHHAPQQLRRMVARLEAEQLDLASLMVRLSITRLAEKAVIPAFIFFFRLLYPFRWVGDPANSTAGAAGGYMLIRRASLERIGGLTAIKGALIDDCALAIAIKRAGGLLSLDLADETYSLRRYDRVSELWMMIARSAYTQLNHSPWLLAGTVLAMSLGFLAPPLVTIFGGDAAWPAALAWIAMSIAYLPVLRYHQLPSWVAPFLPIVALFYLGATLDSARRHWLGRGGQWKGRVQAQPAPHAPMSVSPEKK